VYRKYIAQLAPGKSSPHTQAVSSPEGVGPTTLTASRNVPRESVVLMSTNSS